ncbi:ABC transporter ATP-binding protein [Vineibacter terrae]|uniref:ABC transporter ATP-binding protein n=1 Tax=Vineibacter terrae TaxID=2586908 RepID=A0A5C8PRV6_9HYPH|nr:ABC transporter ATP-binding protein [Vineibacter terrae]TXL78122.1 ABC transporter ATP-binding protein [Vineibacter terrae]
MTTTLEIEGLTVAYGGAPVVDGVSLAVPAGSVVALLGANGAGKSSLMRAVMGLVPSTARRLAVDGRDLAGHPPERRADAGLGYVPEGRRVFAGLTVRENIEVAVDGAAGARAARVAEMLELFPDLAAKAGERAWRLSGGQQQMLAIARALARRPSVLLLDEPSLGLAPLIAAAVFARLRAVAESGVAVLLAEQNAARALAIADTAIVLAHGRVALVRPAAGLSADDEALAALLA